MKISRLKKSIYFLITALLLFGGARIYYHLTDDFRLSNIKYEFPFDSPWNSYPLSLEESEEVSAILKQKFHYIGKGAQCYAFASEDENYVIKFFKFKHLKPSLFVDLLPPIPPFSYYKNNCVERKKRKLIGVFNGYDLAYREDKEGSQLLYVHLIPTNFLKQHVTVVDKLGISRDINVDEVVFLLQRKGVTLRHRLDQLLKENKVKQAEEAIAAITDMYVKEYRRGVFDHDHGVMQNTGFVGEKPFHLDVGKLRKEERMRETAFYKHDLEHVLWKMGTWIKKTNPQYYVEISTFLEELYQHYTEEPLDFNAIDPQRFQHKRP